MWYLARGWWVLNDGVTCHPIQSQRQAHETVGVRNS